MYECNLLSGKIFKKQKHLHMEYQHYSKTCPILSLLVQFEFCPILNFSCPVDFPSLCCWYLLLHEKQQGHKICRIANLTNHHLHYLQLHHHLHHRSHVLPTVELNYFQQCQKLINHQVIKFLQRNRQASTRYIQYQNRFQTFEEYSWRKC